jgi:hypothetical protein
MEHQDYLFTIAEVAAAFVGFSMVVGALSPDRPGSRFRLVVIHDVAVIGFIVMGGALAPYALAQTTLATGVVWRIASSGLLALWLFGYLTSFRRFREAGGSALGEPLLGRPLAVINTGVVIIGNGLLLWNVTFPGPGAGIRYLVALLMLLLIATWLFLLAGFRLRN